ERAITAETLRDDTLDYLSSLNGNNSTSPRAVELSKKLYHILIGSIDPNPQEQNRLCIIPEKFLCYLPFSSLISPDTGKYLIENRPIFYAGSLNVLLECSWEASRKPRINESILSIGDPSFDREAYAGLQRLDAADREAREIAKKFESSICFIGPDASKSAFLQ